jgi:hypothetical protein
MRSSSLRRAFIGLRTRSLDGGWENHVLASVRRAMTRIETKKSHSSQFQRPRFPRARQTERPHPTRMRERAVTLALAQAHRLARFGELKTTPSEPFAGLLLVSG